MVRNTKERYGETICWQREPNMKERYRVTDVKEHYNLTVGECGALVVLVWLVLHKEEEVVCELQRWEFFSGILNDSHCRKHESIENSGQNVSANTPYPRESRLSWLNL